MPTLALTGFNICCSVLGGFISIFGLVSYLLKEEFYLSEALISLLFGVVFSPYATNFIRPLEYARGDEENLNNITLYFSRLVLGVQLVLAGVQLPSKYLQLQWKPLSLLLGPVMTVMWLMTSLLVWGLVPSLPFLHALAVGACITPTDPILSNVIVKGKFADHNVPKDLQKIIIAESGANDGLGYPFLFLALYLIRYVDGDQAISPGGVGTAMGMWFGETWGYEIIISVIYGAIVGWLANKMLYVAEERGWVDRESFLVFSLSLALFIVGTCGMIGSDDVLACFIAGNVLTWDDRYRLATLDESCSRSFYSLQPTIDMLLNVSIFLWYGAVCPWPSFLHNDALSLGRLVALCILILLLRRLPVILAFKSFIPQLKNYKEAVFMGFFGPIGVSGVFYLYITLEYTRELEKQSGEGEKEALKLLSDTVTVVVWFMVVSSCIVHGLSIPVGKLGLSLPRTISRTVTISRPLTFNTNGTPVATTANDSRSATADALPLDSACSSRRKRNSSLPGLGTILSISFSGNTPPGPILPVNHAPVQSPQSPRTRFVDGKGRLDLHKPAEAGAGDGEHVGHSGQRGELGGEGSQEEEEAAKAHSPAQSSAQDTPPVSGHEDAHHSV